MKRLFSILIISIFSFLIIPFVWAEAGSLYLSPSTGTYNIGTNFSVSININSRGAQINAAEANLTFNPQILSVVNISKTNSIFPLWTTEPTFSNTAGTINFGGGTPTPFIGTAGRIIAITFRGRISGTANVNFISGAVLAADGRGTNVLTNMSNANYVIRSIIIPPPPIEVPVDTQVPEPFEIKIDNEGIPTNPRPILRFETKDLISGIDFYEIKVGEQEPIIITPAELLIEPFRLPFQKPGKHSVIIKAIDRAGNYTLALKDFIIEIIEPPTIIAFPEKLQEGDFLFIKGKSLPNYIVLVYTQKEKDTPTVTEIKTDEKGSWNYIHNIKVTEGIYKVWAKNRDVRGAISEATTKIVIPVILPPWLQIGKIAIDYLIIIFTLLLLIISVIAIIFYTRYKIFLWQKEIKKETKEASQITDRTFRVLEEEIQKQIEFLDKKAGLTKREKEIRNKMQEVFDLSKKFISKEIEDIEEKLK